MSSIPAIDIEVSEDYTDVLCHGTGVTDLQFSNPLSRVVKNVSKAELVAYDLPCRKNTVDDSNDCLDFEMGPEIGRVFVTDPGYGYDRFNPPNLHVVNYRSFDNNDKEKNAPVGNAAYYPPWGNRSISGIRLQQGGDASPLVTADKYKEAGVVPQIAKQDLISFGCDVSNYQLAHTTLEGIITNQPAQKCYMVRASDVMTPEASLQVDKPFEYPYHIHISRNVISTAKKSTSTVGADNTNTNAITEVVTDGFDYNGPRLFSDKIKLYRAFYRYSQYLDDNDADIDVLGTQIEMEINYVLGWDVRAKEGTGVGTNVYDMNDHKFTSDNEYRWDVEFQHLLHVKTGDWPSPSDSPLHSPRYQIRYYNGVFTLVDLFNEPFSLAGSFNAAPLQSQKKMVSNIGFLDMERNDDDEYYLSKFLAFGGLYPCVTTIFGILGFAVKNEIPQLSPAVTYTHFNGQQSTLFGYTSEADAREILKQQWALYLHARPASFKMSVHKCTARLRHGVYAIGSVIHQNYRRKAANNSDRNPSLEINVRQASDGLIKEVQDQMNIAFHGPGICVQVGDTNNISEAHLNRKQALHYPLLSGGTFSNNFTSIFADRKSPHKFVVTLEDADIYDGTIAQSATNLRSNQNRKTRVRISFSESHAQAQITRPSLRILNRTGANASRSIANMLGFSSEDVSDQQFVSYIPVPSIMQNDPDANYLVTDPPNYSNETEPRYTYGVQAQSTFDTSVRSKSCRIELGINQNSSYTPLATAMVAGRTDHANTTCNTDGSVQSFLNEQLRLLGSNRFQEIEDDTTKTSLYAEPQLGTVVSSYIRPVSQNNLNTPVFRAIDWGVRPIVLDKRYNVGELFFRVLDGRNQILWPCNASETTFFMIRLHHPLMENNQRKHHENRQFI